MAVFVWIAVEEKENQSLRIIEVVDENKLFFMESSQQYAFSFSDSSPEEAKLLVQNGDRYGFLYIPKIDLKNPQGITFYGEENPSMSLVSYLESSLKKKIEDQRLYDSVIDPQILSDIRTSVDLKSITLNQKGEEKVSAREVQKGEE